MTTKRPVAHIEFPARERLKTAEFYQKIFGWGVQDFDDMGYTMLDNGQQVTVGVNQATDEQPGALTFYIESRDIEGDLKQVEAHGGQLVVPKTEIPGQGWFAFFKDPSGNIVGLGDFIQQEG